MRLRQCRQLPGLFRVPAFGKGGFAMAGIVIAGFATSGSHMTAPDKTPEQFYEIS